MPTAESLMTMQLVLAAAEESETLQVIPHLEQHGWQVVRAKTGIEAFSMVEQLHPLAAIVDVDISDLTGWDFVTRLRQDPMLRSTVVILIYPVGSPDKDYFRGHEVGADVNLSAPVDPRELVSFLSRVNGRHLER